MAKHIHFVQSIETAEGGGLGMAAVALSRSMGAVGRSSSVVATGTIQSTEKGVDVYRRIGPTKMFFSWAMSRAVDSLVDGADIVHGHGFYVATNWLFGRAARHHRRTLVYHPHGMFEPWILNRSRIKKRIAHFLYEDANFKYASLWRALTGREADQIRAQGIVAPIIVSSNGIDVSDYDLVAPLRQARKSTGGIRNLLFLGRLHPKKGLPLLVEAWRQLPGQARSGWRVVIAGPDELGHRAQLQSLIKTYGLERDFEFIGPVSGARKLEVLADSDAFILPSHSEGFSIAILEALACRLPVLATDACNFPEVATLGGGWCMAAELGPLTAALAALIGESGDGLSQRGERGRALVESRYSWARIAHDIAIASEELADK